MIKHELPLQFGHEQLTSYGGLELVRRYFQLIELKARIRQALGKHTRGDYGGTHLVLLVIGSLRRVDYSTATQDSLPDGWPAFPGGAGYPLGPNERFQFFSSSLTRLHLAHSFFQYRNQEAGTTIPTRANGRSGWAPTG